MGWQWLHKLLATGFGAGYSRFAPGTMGAVVACVISLALSKAGLYNYVSFNLVTGLLVLSFLIIGVFVSNKLEPVWGKDPARIVIDEMVGVWIAIIFIPFSVTSLLLGFFFFRIFDIWKPLGIRQLENLPGGWGVMIDDVLAGLYANLAVRIVLILFLV